MRHIVSLGLLAVLALAGCTRPAVREKPVADPLFTTKKPVEGTPHLAGLSSVPAEEVPLPQPPPVLHEPPRPLIGVRLVGER